jgi:hypothetical protein
MGIPRRHMIDGGPAPLILNLGTRRGEWGKKQIKLSTCNISDSITEFIFNEVNNVLSSLTVHSKLAALSL